MNFHDQDLDPAVPEVARGQRALGLVIVAAAIAFAAVLASAFVGCVPGLGAESAYTAEMLRCVDKAESRIAADACKAGVRARWGVTDAGGDR